MALETESRRILFDLLTQFLEQNLESRGSSHFWIEGVKNDLNPFPVSGIVNHYYHHNDRLSSAY